MHRARPPRSANGLPSCKTHGKLVNSSPAPYITRWDLSHDMYAFPFSPIILLIEIYVDYVNNTFHFSSKALALPYFQMSNFGSKLVGSKYNIVSFDAITSDLH